MVENTASGARETYIGLTGDTFKSRFNNHTASFRIREKKILQNSVNSSGNYNNISFFLSWKILARASAYSNCSKRCNLCITEKYFIICKRTLGTLNKRNELSSACRHANSFLLRNLKFLSLCKLILLFKYTEITLYFKHLTRVGRYGPLETTL